MGDNKYNGWTNWYTWNFKLWIDNEESSHSAVMELAQGKDAYELSFELKQWTDDMLKAVKLEAGFLADVCNSAIKEINFFEIAETYIEEIK